MNQRTTGTSGWRVWAAVVGLSVLVAGCSAPAGESSVMDFLGDLARGMLAAWLL